MIFYIFIAIIAVVFCFASGVYFYGGNVDDASKAALCTVIAIGCTISSCIGWFNLGLNAKYCPVCDKNYVDSDYQVCPVDGTLLSYIERNNQNE